MKEYVEKEMKVYYNFMYIPQKLEIEQNMANAYMKLIEIADKLDSRDKIIMINELKIPLQDNGISRYMACEACHIF